MSGVDLLDQMRAESRNADVPVIVLTVVAEKGAVAGFRVTDGLAKPLDTHALLHAPRRAPAWPPPHRAGPAGGPDHAGFQVMGTTPRPPRGQTLSPDDGAT